VQTISCRQLCVGFSKDVTIVDTILMSRQFLRKNLKNYPKTCRTHHIFVDTKKSPRCSQWLRHKMTESAISHQNTFLLGCIVTKWYFLSLFRGFFGNGSQKYFCASDPYYGSQQPEIQSKQMKAPKNPII
jgi:hypothetical protein